MPRTWRDSVELVLWFAASYLVALITLAGLLASLVTVWIIGLGVVVRASVLRLLAQTVRADRRRIELTFGVRIESFAAPRPDPEAPFLDRQRSWARSRLLWGCPPTRSSAFRS